MLVTIQRQRSSKRVILGHAWHAEPAGPSCERVEVERGEVRSLLAHSTHLEGQGRADREEPGERAREAIEVGLHQGALLVLEELDVALPDEILGRPSGLRGRRPVLQDTASLVDRLEAGEDGGVVGLPSGARVDIRSRPRRCRTRGAPRRCRRKWRCSSRGSCSRPRAAALSATEAVRDVHVAGAIGVQPERKEGEPDVVRRERGHPGPLEGRGQELVDPGVARRDHQSRGMRRTVVRSLGQRLPAGDRVRRPVAGRARSCPTRYASPPAVATAERADTAVGKHGRAD